MGNKVENIVFCEDCHIFEHTGDGTFLDYYYDEKNAGKRRQKIETDLLKLKKMGNISPTGEVDEFSKRLCSCCGNPWPGKRYYQEIN